MAVLREDPYASFNYRVLINVKSGVEIHAGFSDVSGLSTEISYAEYRNGNEPRARPRKIPSTYKVGDVTLKRGLISATDIFEWIEQVRTGRPDTRATVNIELLDENNQNVVGTWVLEGARPSKYTGPTLAAKGGTEVAMEELVLVCEEMRFE